MTNRNCSLSARIPGVADRVSPIFNGAELPGLRMIEINDIEAFAQADRRWHILFPNSSPP